MLVKCTDNLHKIERNFNCSKIVIFACKYTKIGMIACNFNQNWYFCSMQTITVCTTLAICFMLLQLLRTDKYLGFKLHLNGIE